MNPKYTKLMQYLSAIGGEMTFQEDESLEKTCPLSVSLRYDAAKATLFDKQRLLLFSRDVASLTPDQVQNHVHVLAEAYSIPMLFVFQEASREFCTSLIKKRLPFIVPKRQCYIPDFLVLLNEKAFRNVHERKIEHLSPFAQVVFLYYLLHRELSVSVSFQQIINGLQAVPKVYVTRAAQELSAVNLATITSEGRLKSLRFEGPRKELWEKAQPYLRSPVLRLVRVESQLPPLPLAGFSALAEFSCLNSEEEQTFAVYSRDFDKSLPTFEFSGQNLELWRYDPKAILAYAANKAQQEYNKRKGA